DGTPLRLGRIGLNLCLIFPRLDAALVLRDVQAELRGEFLNHWFWLVGGFAVPAVLILEKQVVHLPEFGLLTRTPGRAMCWPGVAVNGQRIIHESKANDARLYQSIAHIRLSECREAAARRTLEVAELH